MTANVMETRYRRAYTYVTIATWPMRHPHSNDAHARLFARVTDTAVVVYDRYVYNIIRSALYCGERVRGPRVCPGTPRPNPRPRHHRTRRAAKLALPTRCGTGHQCGATDAIRDERPERKTFSIHRSTMCCRESGGARTPTRRAGCVQHMPRRCGRIVHAGYGVTHGTTHARILGTPVQ